MSNTVEEGNGRAEEASTPVLKADARVKALQKGIKEMTKLVHDAEGRMSMDVSSIDEQFHAEEYANQLNESYNIMDPEHLKQSPYV